MRVPVLLELSLVGQDLARNHHPESNDTFNDPEFIRSRAQRLRETDVEILEEPMPGSLRVPGEFQIGTGVHSREIVRPSRHCK
jgi:hypothetical protein